MSFDKNLLGPISRFNQFQKEDIPEKKIVCTKFIDFSCYSVNKVLTISIAFTRTRY